MVSPESGIHRFSIGSKDKDNLSHRQIMAEWYLSDNEQVPDIPKSAIASACMHASSQDLVVVLRNPNTRQSESAQLKWTKEEIVSDLKKKGVDQEVAKRMTEVLANNIQISIVEFYIDKGYIGIVNRYDSLSGPPPPEIPYSVKLATVHREEKFNPGSTSVQKK